MMNITIYAGGRSWVVDESRLVNWLAQNAAQAQERTIVREVTDDGTGRVLLNESVATG